ncbi:hypothetical protein NIES3974_34930 [Calothrix sp. NIES-3974]|nr:hypothetical protein NIES3974_34930 [Calothrix sp. NIES-3974]
MLETLIWEETSQNNVKAFLYIHLSIFIATFCLSPTIFLFGCVQDDVGDSLENRESGVETTHRVVSRGVGSRYPPLIFNGIDH